jgi:hypothetical protein
MNPLLTKLATLVKTATSDDEGDQFDEKVPVQEDENTDKGEKPVKNAQPGQQPPQEAPVEPVVEEPMPQEGPEAFGARAAQAFIGPEVFQAAAQGDQAAIDIVARTAGQIAASTAQAAATAMSTPAPGGEVVEGAEGAEGAPAAPVAAPGAAPEAAAAPVVATPEEEVANQIVAEPAQATPSPQAPVDATPPDQAQNGQPQQQGAAPAPDAGADIQPAGTGPNGEPLYDEAAIEKIIALVKAGKL